MQQTSSREGGGGSGEWGSSPDLCSDPTYSDSESTQTCTEVFRRSFRPHYPMHPRSVKCVIHEGVRRAHPWP